MRQRLEILRRLGAVYELVEEMHSMEARMAAHEVNVVESAVRSEVDALIAARDGEREAIREEDRMGRSSMAAQGEVAGQRRRQLEPILERRQKISEAASTRHRNSRLWSERMKSLIETEASRITAVEERRRQLFLDDRFLAGRSRGKGAKKDEAEKMNLS